MLDVQTDCVDDRRGAGDSAHYRAIIADVRTEKLDAGRITGKRQTAPIGIPRGDPNHEPGIEQVANNAAAKKAGAAKYSYASRRHKDKKYRAALDYPIIRSASRSAKAGLRQSVSASEDVLSQVVGRAKPSGPE
jgi:hypothetical protein